LIGTPLSPNATRVMLLGSGELGKEVVIALQRFGVEVIAVDRYANAPAQQVAHRAHVIDMTDPAALRALIEKEKPHLVVPEIEAIATPALVALESEGKAVVIPTARAAFLTMNREGIRRLAAEELGLPTSDYRFASSLEELQQACQEIGFPCFVKPVMSSSGKGQSKLKSAAEVSAAWDHAQASGRVAQARVIVESLIDFDFEITQLTVRAAGPAKAAESRFSANAGTAEDADRAAGMQSAVETHFCAPIGHIQVDGDYVESWQPQPMSEEALEKARQIAGAVTASLGGYGLFGVELFVKGDQVWFSEVSPRPHDTGMVTMATQAQNEFELHARAILGLPVDTSLRNPGASAVIYGELDATGIGFLGVDEALQIHGTDIRLFGKPESFKKRRMGVALASGKDTDQARDRAKAAAALVKPVKPR
jgi:phosphoribosylglycinamide formyltransferase 2